jgi:hypothetical protein
MRTFLPTYFTGLSLIMAKERPGSTSFRASGLKTRGMHPGKNSNVKIRKIKGLIEHLRRFILSSSHCSVPCQGARKHRKSTRPGFLGSTSVSGAIYIYLKLKSLFLLK